MFEFYSVLLNGKPFKCGHWLSFYRNVLNCSNSTCLARCLCLTCLQIRSGGEVDFRH